MVMSSLGRGRAAAGRMPRPGAFVGTGGGESWGLGIGQVSSCLDPHMRQAPSVSLYGWSLCQGV